MSYTIWLQNNINLWHCSSINNRKRNILRIITFDKLKHLVDCWWYIHFVKPMYCYWVNYLNSLLFYDRSVKNKQIEVAKVYGYWNEKRFTDNYITPPHFIFFLKISWFCFKTVWVNCKCRFEKISFYSKHTRQPLLLIC